MYDNDGMLWIIFQFQDGYIDERVAKESLCLARGGEMYLSLCDKVASALYKYSLGTWSLLTKRPGQSFIDCQGTLLFM